jgi:5-(carboxyamino)imidazole ribonucleotide synthase
MIGPGAWLGLLGGGQLGRMFTMAAQSMGYRVAVLDPGKQSPAGSVADRHIAADYLDDRALAEMASLCAAATTEFENVPAESLRTLARRCVVSPAADSVAIAQDRIREKVFLRDSGLAVAPFAVVRNEADLAAPEVDALLPGVLKVSRFGYDGKGQIRVANRADLDAAFSSLRREPCVLERLLALDKEISVVVACGSRGEVVTWPVAENQHAHGILDISIAPARVTPALAERARNAAVEVAGKLRYRGVLCVEFFLVSGGELLVNEIAPRPHNSGHYTIDACITSQFEQQVRALCGLPLGDTRMHCPAVMVNLLGELWSAGEPRWEQVLRHFDVKLHLYGKSEPRPGRKMGHFTVLAQDVDSALRLAKDIKSQLVDDAAVQPGASALKTSQA